MYSSVSHRHEVQIENTEPPTPGVIVPQTGTEALGWQLPILLGVFGGERVVYQFTLSTIPLDVVCHKKMGESVVLRYRVWVIFLKSNTSSTCLRPKNTMFSFSQLLFYEIYGICILSMSTPSGTRFRLRRSCIFMKMPNSGETHRWA